MQYVAHPSAGSVYSFLTAPINETVPDFNTDDNPDRFFGVPFAIELDYLEEVFQPLENGFTYGPDPEVIDIEPLTSITRFEAIHALY